MALVCFQSSPDDLNVQSHLRTTELENGSQTLVQSHRWAPPSDCLRWGQSMCMSNKHPGDADATSLGTTLS